MKVQYRFIFKIVQYFQIINLFLENINVEKVVSTNTYYTEYSKRYSQNPSFMQIIHTVMQVRR